MITKEDLIKQGNWPESSPLIGMSQKDINRYSLCRVLRKLERLEQPDGLEAECNKEIVRGGMGSNAVEGFAVPWDISPDKMQRDLNVNTFAQGGGFVQTDVSPTVVPILRNKIAAKRLGAVSLVGLTGNFSIPRQTSASVVQSQPEQGTNALTTLTIDQPQLMPHRVSATAAYSKQLIQQSAVDVEIFLRDDLFSQVAVKLDYLVLNGSGSQSEPLGILNTAGVGSVAFNGAASWSKVLDFESALANSNADTPGAKIAWLTSPNVRNAWKRTAKTGIGVTSIVPIFLWDTAQWNDDSGDGICNGYRGAVSNQVPNNLVIFGNWKEIVIGIWGSGIDITINPYTRAASATVEITINTYFDVLLRHPQSFVVSSDAGNQ